MVSINIAYNDASVAPIVLVSDPNTEGTWIMKRHHVDSSILGPVPVSRRLSETGLGSMVAQRLSKAESGLATKLQVLRQLAVAIHEFVAPSYRPELHYMRGFGPASAHRAVLVEARRMPPGRQEGK
jgi:hypothetical protein